MYYFFFVFVLLVEYLHHIDLSDFQKQISTFEIISKSFFKVAPSDVFLCGKDSTRRLDHNETLPSPVYRHIPKVLCGIEIREAVMVAGRHRI